MTGDRSHVLWFCGPSGVGKSTVGWEVFRQLSRSGVTTGFLDLDQISLLQDDGTHRVRARNLAAVWPNFRAAGARCLVLAGYVDTVDEVREYTDRLPDAALTLCRLRVGATELKERFLARGWRPDLVDDAVAEAEALEHTDHADLSVDTDGLAVSEVARLVRERVLAWPCAAPMATPSGSVPVPQEAPVSVSAPAAVLWFSGATAVGKSTVGYEVFSRVFQAGVPAAYVDLKQIGALGPTADASESHRLTAQNLAALWTGYHEAGARYLIVSGGADRDDTVRRYAGLFPGTALTVCRLHAGPATLAERVAQRGRGEGPAIPGDAIKGLGAEALRGVVERASRDAESLERAGAGDVRVDTDGRSVQDVADQVRALVGGWLDPSSAPPSR
ncbi:adenylyl-sulfate kinase [Streptomyces sp. NBC_00316]|uniref:adenylyl-sulfate kinase n=1 Tax=Streptomyces sp. NBC_00316 TaxID=2975710 RepID=UPI002E2A97B1|nr:adenylyl-sulfate kinase [Streptomyces sp. NBC_00316]